MNQAVIDERKKQLAFLYLALDDLRLASIYAKALLENEGNKNIAERYSPRTNALDLALVVSYSRPFKTSYGFEAVRKCMDEFVQEFNEKEKRLHDQIIALRDQEYAHSDAEANAIELLLDGRFLYSKKVVRCRLSFELIHQLTEIIERLMNTIKVRAKELRESLPG